MADLSEFHNAEAGMSRAKPPTTSFQFKPGAEIGEAELYLSGDETAQDALDKWAALLLGLDYGTMSILEVLEVRAWGENPSTGEPYRYVKAAVRKAKQQDLAIAQTADKWLAQHPRKPRKAKPARKTGTRASEWWPITDTQLGKDGEERFGGLSETMARLDWVVDAFTEWHEQRKKIGYTAERIIIPFAGDTTEGCHGSFDNQPWVTALNAADQQELAVAAAERVIERAIELAPEVIITGVASNHDRQSRVNTKENVTDAWDDRTFVLLRTLGRIYHRVGYSQVSVQMPANPHVSVIDDGFLNVATIHGHKPKWTQNAAQTMWRWWGQEIANRRDASACQVLLAGHYHHAYELGPQSGRMLIGLPSLDGGSAWFEATGQDWSLPGVRPFLTTAEGVRELSMLVWPEDRRQAEEQTGGKVA